MDGFYSKKAASLFGFIEYKDFEGKSVYVTEVVKQDKSPLSNYNDLVYVGKVDKFVQNNQILHSKSLDELLALAYDRAKEQEDCAKQLKQTKRCFCCSCKINNKN